MADSKVLVKFPCRSRPEQFVATLNRTIEMSTQHDIHYLISLDADDHSMSHFGAIFQSFENITVVYGQSVSKIAAVNRDMWKVPDHFKDWSIGVLLSDDMICQVPAWDEVLRAEMKEHFPDTDGCLFHWDGDPATAKHNNGKGLCTMNIMGRKAFDKLGYWYHPTYMSLWSDNEFTDVMQSENKMFKSDVVLFKHEHFSNNGTQPDKLMQKTQSYYESDKANYDKRKSLNFPR